MQLKEFKYRPAFDMNDNDALQKMLNELYNYSTSTDFDTMFNHRMRLNLFYEVMQDLVSKKTITRFEKAIDIGCNAGVYSKMISDFGFKDVYGIDIDDKQLSVAITNFTSAEPGKTIRFENFNAEQLPPSVKYDFIVCSEVIEHTSNPQQVIANIKEILNEGGIGVISLPNGMSLPFFFSWLGKKVKGKPINGELRDHLKFPSYRTIRLFEQAGVRILQTTGTNLFYWHVYKFVLKSRLFIKLNYWLSKHWPFKYYSQFFYLIITK